MYCLPDKKLGDEVKIRSKYVNQRIKRESGYNIHELHSVVHTML